MTKTCWLFIRERVRKVCFSQSCSKLFDSFRKQNSILRKTINEIEHVKVYDLFSYHKGNDTKVQTALAAKELNIILNGKNKPVVMQAQS